MWQSTEMAESIIYRLVLENREDQMWVLRIFNNLYVFLLKTPTRDSKILHAYPGRDGSILNWTSEVGMIGTKQNLKTCTKKFLKVGSRVPRKF